MPNISRLQVIPDKIKAKLGKNSGLKKILSNVSWLFAERILAMAVSFFIGVYVIRYLGVVDFGKLSYGVSFVALFASLAKLGLDSIVVRNLVQEEEATSEILGTAFLLKLIAAVVTVALIAYSAIAFKGEPETYWITTIIGLGLVFNSFEVVNFWFQSQVLSKAVAIVRSIQLIISSVSKLCFIALKLPLMAFVWLLLIETIIRALGMVWIYARHSQSIWYWRFKFDRAIALLQDSWPLILSAVMVTIYMKIDQVMLGNMADNRAVGNYAAAVRFSEVWYFVPTAICSSVFPSIIRAKQRSRTEYNTKLQQLYDLMAGMSLLLALIMTFASSTIVSGLLGEGYTEAGNILALHIWAGPFVFLGVARSQWLMAENLTWLSFATTSLGTVTNLLLNFWLIPFYGGVGAAIATVISYAVASYFTCLLYPKMFGTAWMLTKALLIPVRWRLHLRYLKRIKKMLL